MRAHEFLPEHQIRKPNITLRQLHKLKRDEQARSESHAQNQAFFSVMYADPDREQRALDLEKARLELDELKADIAATRAKTLADIQKLAASEPAMLRQARRKA